MALSIRGGLWPDHRRVKLAEEIDFALRIPRNAFSAVAKLIEQRAER